MYKVQVSNQPEPSDTNLVFFWVFFTVPCLPPQGAMAETLGIGGFGFRSPKPCRLLLHCCVHMEVKWGCWVEIYHQTEASKEGANFSCYVVLMVPLPRFQPEKKKKRLR